MQKVKEGKLYAWYWDALQGVGRFERLKDGALSLIETGADALYMRDLVDSGLHDIDRLAQAYEYDSDSAAICPLTEFFVIAMQPAKGEAWHMLSRVHSDRVTAEKICAAHQAGHMTGVANYQVLSVWLEGVA